MLLLLLRKQRETSCNCNCSFALTLTLNAPGSHPGNKDFSIFFVASWVCLGCLYFEFSLRVRSMMASYLHHERVTAVWSRAWCRYGYLHGLEDAFGKTVMQKGHSRKGQCDGSPLSFCILGQGNNHFASEQCHDGIIPRRCIYTCVGRWCFWRSCYIACACDAVFGRCRLLTWCSLTSLLGCVGATKVATPRESRL